MSDQVLKWQLPEKLGFLVNERHRWKVAYGGRDGAKSWSFARALLILGSLQPLRIGCFREVQESIHRSVYKLLCDQIESMGLSSCYDPLKTEIRGKNGTEIGFSGLSSQTRDSIKSFEGLDIVWVEEAHSVSEQSWDILEPTIRKPNSEIWVSFNPEMDTDATYKMLVLDEQPGSKVIKIGWEDNPWRSEVLDGKRTKMQRDDPDKYAHVYGGECRPAVLGAIYYNEVSKLRSTNRLCNAPYDPMLKVHVVCDLGFNDFMSLLLVQRLGSEIRIIKYIEDRFRFIPDYSQELRSLNLNYGSIYLPHDGFQQTLIAKDGSAAKQFQALGWDVQPVPNVEIEQGIRKAREVFPRIYIDREQASELLNRLGRYRRRVNSDGQASTPMHDDESHGADGFRYLALVADQLSNDKRHIDPKAFYGAF